jgi:hypothetical protein
MTNEESLKIVPRKVATSLLEVAALDFAALGLDISGLVSVEESLAPDDTMIEKQ